MADRRNMSLTERMLAQRLIIPGQHVVELQRSGSRALAAEMIENTRLAYERGFLTKAHHDHMIAHFRRVVTAKKDADQ